MHVPETIYERREQIDHKKLQPPETVIDVNEVKNVPIEELLSNDS
jgi:hypothetical protein